ncbi:hypothetical protein P3T18_004457 [Paraburkholderia sp. GAS199]
MDVNLQKPDMLVLQDDVSALTLQAGMGRQAGTCEGPTI